MSEPVPAADVIIAIRKQLGLTQRDVATSLRLTEKTVQRWENGAAISSKNWEAFRALARKLLAKGGDAAYATARRPGGRPKKTYKLFTRWKRVSRYKFNWEPVRLRLWCPGPPKGEDHMHFLDEPPSAPGDRWIETCKGEGVFFTERGCSGAPVAAWRYRLADDGSHIPEGFMRFTPTQEKPRGGDFALVDAPEGPTPDELAFMLKHGMRQPDALNKVDTDIAAE